MTFPVYVTRPVLTAIFAHFKAAADRQKEALGLLVGTPCVDASGVSFTLVSAYATGQNDATSTHVRFAPPAFSNLSKLLSERGKGELVVGWAHSHPSYGCFLSPTDLKTQQDYFPERFHAALVIDPLKGEKGQTRFFQLTPDKKSYSPVAFAVVENK
jgi:proteasome lid subunit RPN8/RPN11